MPVAPVALQWLPPLQPDVMWLLMVNLVYYVPSFVLFGVDLELGYVFSL